MLDVSVIIVNYNSGPLLRDCLTSLYTYSRDFNFSVTVFDNASTDDGLKKIEGDFPKVKMIRSQINLGFAKANNRAITGSALAQYYLLLNPDVFFESNAIKSVMDFMAKNPSIGICGPKIVLPCGKLDSPCRRSFKSPATYLYHIVGLSRLFPRSRRFGRYYLSYLNEDEACEVDSVMGAFLMIRRQTLEQIGLLDEHFYIYAEDEDWCWRAKQAGWKVFYYPRACVLHLKGTSTSERKLPMIYQWHRAAFVFHRKNLAATNSFLINWFIYLGIAVHLGAALFLNGLKLGMREVLGKSFSSLVSGNRRSDAQ